MNHNNGKYKVDDIVYANYGPKNPGKVLSITTKPWQFSILGSITAEIALVRWTRPIGDSMGRSQVKLKEREYPVAHLNSLNELITTHEKTVNNHKKRLKVAKEL